MQEKNAPREVFFVERYAMERLSAALLRVRGLKRVKKSFMYREWTDNGPIMRRHWTDNHPRKTAGEIEN